MSLNDSRRIFILRDVHASCIVDGHMHINSGSCVPIPLLYAQVEKNYGRYKYLRYTGYANTRNPPEYHERLGFIDGVNMQRLSTEEIGKRVAQINLASYYTLKDSIEF